MKVAFVSLVLSVSSQVLFGCIYTFLLAASADFCGLVVRPENMFQHVSTQSLSFSPHGLTVAPECDKQLHPHEKLRRRTRAGSGCGLQVI